MPAPPHVHTSHRPPAAAPQRRSTGQSTGQSAGRSLRRWLSLLALAIAGSQAIAAGGGQASLDADFSDKFLMLGTGPVGGAFRPIGESLCDAINEDRQVSLVRCVPVGTAGSTFNLHAVSNKAIQLGIAQEDLLAQMYQGPRPAPGRALRSIAVLHTSPIAVMVRKGRGIDNLRQIAGKRINLGNRGSGQFAVTAAILRALQLQPEDFAAVSYLATSDFEQAFCGGQVDVVVEAVAHPSAMFEKLRACGGEFLDIPPAVIERMLAENRWLSPMQIAAGLYPQQERPVQTLGMRNVLFSNVAVDEQSIYRLTLSVRQRLAELRRSQPLLGSMAGLDQGEPSGLPAPLHAGAQRAFRQALSKDAP